MSAHATKRGQEALAPVRPVAGKLAHRGKRMSPTRERGAIMAAVRAEDERTIRSRARRGSSQTRDKSC
jgi:hypothetical protein